MLLNPRMFNLQIGTMCSLYGTRSVRYFKNVLYVASFSPLALQYSLYSLHSCCMKRLNWWVSLIYIFCTCMPIVHFTFLVVLGGSNLKSSFLYPGIHSRSNIACCSAKLVTNVTFSILLHKMSHCEEVFLCFHICVLYIACLSGL